LGTRTVAVLILDVLLRSAKAGAPTSAAPHKMRTRKIIYDFTLGEPAKEARL
jgi:hypothetical protein